MSNEKTKTTRARNSDVQILKNKIDMIEKLTQSVSEEIERMSDPKRVENPFPVDQECLDNETVAAMIAAKYVPIPKPSTLEAGDWVTIGKGEPRFFVKEANIQRGKALFALIQCGDDKPQLWPVRNLRKVK